MVQASLIGPGASPWSSGAPGPEPCGGAAIPLPGGPPGVGRPRTVAPGIYGSSSLIVRPPIERTRRTPLSCSPWGPRTSRIRPRSSVTFDPVGGGARGDLDSGGCGRLTIRIPGGRTCFATSRTMEGTLRPSTALQPGRGGRPARASPEAPPQGCPILGERGARRRRPHPLGIGQPPHLPPGRHHHQPGGYGRPHPHSTLLGAAPTPSGMSTMAVTDPTGARCPKPVSMWELRPPCDSRHRSPAAGARPPGHRVWNVVTVKPRARTSTSMRQSSPTWRPSPGSSRTEAFYIESQRRRRDLSVLVLLDISGSAGEPSPVGGTVHLHQRTVAAALTAALA